MPALVLPVRVSRREVDTSVMNSFPDSQRFSFACTPRWAPGRRLFRSCPSSGPFFVSLVLVWGSSVPSAPYRYVLGEPVVFQCVWITLVKLPEFLQAAY